MDLKMQGIVCEEIERPNEGVRRKEKHSSEVICQWSLLVSTVPGIKWPERQKPRNSYSKLKLNNY